MHTKVQFFFKSGDTKPLHTVAFRLINFQSSVWTSTKCHWHNHLKPARLKTKIFEIHGKHQGKPQLTLRCDHILCDTAPPPSIRENADIINKEKLNEH